MFADYYTLLDIKFDATEEQIKKAYRIKAIQYHPDKHFGNADYSQMFIEIKDAYDVLIDSQRRKIYDIEYIQEKRDMSHPIQNDKHVNYDKTKDNNEKFCYNPSKQFYSEYDRELQETPQYKPIYNFWFKIIPDDFVFFIFPKKIGKIICGFSDLKQEMLLSSKKHSKGGFWAKLFTKKFIHYNYYIGVNGFAIFKCEDNIDNITEITEVNFNDIVDLYFIDEDIGVNCEYGFSWLAKNLSDTIFFQGKYNKDDVKQLETINIVNPEYIERNDINYIFQKNAEIYWTVYLLDKMESELQKKGFIEFRLMIANISPIQYATYIQLGIGFITFLIENKTTTYKFDEIKRMYIKKNVLYIQHNNYKKTFFHKEGNEDIIPLLSLCNRRFFYKALELLLGYKLL